MLCLCLAAGVCSRGQCVSVPALFSGFMITTLLHVNNKIQKITLMSCMQSDSSLNIWLKLQLHPCFWQMISSKVPMVVDLHFFIFIVTLLPQVLWTNLELIFHLIFTVLNWIYITFYFIHIRLVESRNAIYTILHDC